MGFGLLNRGVGDACHILPIRTIRIDSSLPNR
jgi:hypothetical protein